MNREINPDNAIMLVNLPGIGQQLIPFVSVKTAEDAVTDARLLNGGYLTHKSPNHATVIMNISNALIIILPKNEYDKQVMQAQIAAGGAAPRIVR